MRTYDVTVIDETGEPYFWKVPALSIKDAQLRIEISDPGIDVVCISQQRISNTIKKEVIAYAC